MDSPPETPAVETPPMDVQVESLGPCRKKVAITLPPDRVREAFDKRYQEINESIVYPGFRKGHAPRRLLEKRFATSLGREVKEQLVEGAIKQILEEKKVDPIEAPHVDVEALELQPDAPFSFELELVVKPEFETPEYKGVALEVPRVEVAEAEIQAAVDAIRRRDAKLTTAGEGEPLEKSDIAIVDWEAKDGESVVAHDQNVYYPLGRGVLAGFVVETLDAALLGKAPGAKAEATVHVAADDLREELRGKELHLEVELKEVKRYALPPVDEGFLKRHDYDDETEMRAELEKRIRRVKTRNRDQAGEARLLDQLVSGLDISLPEPFVERETERWARRLRMQLEVEGVPEEEIAKRVESGRTDAQAAVENDMRRWFLLDRIAEAEDVSVPESELAQAVQEIASVYQRPEEEVLASFRDGSGLLELETQIKHRKTRELLYREAKVTEVDPPEASAAPEQGAKPAKKRSSGPKSSKKKSKEGEADASAS